MKPHKWAKEIIAWANGVDIQIRKVYSDNDEGSWKTILAHNQIDWSRTDTEYRIKPQEQQSGCCCKQTCSAPKEPQYLLAWEDAGGLHLTSENSYPITSMTYLGKIKLEIGE